MSGPVHVLTGETPDEFQARKDGHCTLGHQYHRDCGEGCVCWDEGQGGEVVLYFKGEKLPPGFKYGIGRH